MRTDCVLPGIQHGQHQIAAGTFHSADHARSGKNAGPGGPQKRDRVIVAHHHIIAAGGPDHEIRHRLNPEAYADFRPASTPRM